ncbi:MAG: hypothetical protein J07HB67_02741 [halophilic archaeon J07HB67]|jgi:hypothetical protein|nr:MAG: hypothetical protein J07HB67_02741 [halophilic archaeon J07HB67]
MSEESHSAVAETPTGDIVDQHRRDLDTVDRVLSVLGFPPLVETAHKVLAVPPERRQAEAVSVVADEYGISNLQTQPEQATVPSGFDAAVSEGLTEIPELTQTLAAVARRLRNAAVTAVVDSRDADDEQVVLVAFFTVIGDLLDAFERRASADDRDEWRAYLSRLVVLTSHGVLVVAGEREFSDDQLVDDFARVADAETTFDTNARSTDTVRTIGALVVYDHSEISVARGAELADSTRDQFETALIAHDIDVRVGPETVEELHEGPTLSDTHGNGG